MDSVLLACSSDFAEGWLMPRLPSLKECYPDMEIWLITKEELRDIDRIDVDLIVSVQSLESTELISVPLLADRAIAVCGPLMASRLLALPFPDVLMAAPLIMDEHRPEWAPCLAEVRQGGDVPHRSITVDDARLLLHSAVHELGIAMVSQLLAAVALQQGRLVLLPQIPGFPLSGLWLTKSRLTPRTPAVEIVFDWLCAAATAVV